MKSEKVGLKLNIEKTKIMVSGPITLWQIDGETVTDFIFGGSKITADGDCRHEIKRHLLLGRKVMSNLDSILKSRNITLPTKVHLVKAMVFPVVMYKCKSWTIKKAECQIIVAFELWCWRRLEKAMAPHSSTFAWKSPWTEEPGRLQSMGSLESDTTERLHFHFSFHALEKEMATHSSVLAWRIPGTGSLVGFRLWGRTESHD